MSLPEPAAESEAARPAAAPGGAPSVGPGAASPIAAAVALISLLAVCVTLSFTPLRASHDEWWHLKTGRWIDEHGLPVHEVFTYSAERYEWHNHEWLTQLMMWRVWRAGELHGPGGVTAVIALKAAFVVAAYFLLAGCSARAGAGVAVSAFAAAVACTLGRRTFYPRPPFVSYAFMAFVLAVLILWRRRGIRDRALICLPPVFALWANMHGGFMAGLVTAGAFWIESALNVVLARWRLEQPDEPRRRFTRLTLALAASFLCTLATPYGHHLYELAGRVMSEARLLDIIYELKPPDWRFVWSLDGAVICMMFAGARPLTRRGRALCAAWAVGYLLLVRGVPCVAPYAVGAWFEGPVRELAAYCALGFAAARSKRLVGPGLLILLLFFAHQSIRHVRHLPLFSIVFAPAFALAVAEWIHEGASNWRIAWSRKPPETWDPAAEEAEHRVLFRRAENVAAALTAALAAFHLFMPGEAGAWVRAAREGRVGEMSLSAPSMLDRNLALLRGTELEPGAYPVAAADFLAASDLPGRLFNGGNYAGYLIWRLSPDRYKVFTDNRYDIWGGDFITDEMIVMDAFEGDEIEGLPSWREVLDRWSANILFVPTASPIHLRLSALTNSGWKLVWDDPAGEGFVIWARENPVPIAAPAP